MDAAAAAPKKKRFVIRKKETAAAAEPQMTPGHYDPPRMPPESWKTLAELMAETPLPTMMPEEAEVRAAVEEWYAVRGQKVPAADLIACKQIGAAAVSDYKALIADLKVPVVHKPVYGTPEFWKQYWAKKKAAAAAAANA